MRSNVIGKVNLKEREITGPSLDACKEVLYKEYGSDYEILDYETVIVPRLFGFSEKPVTHAKYVVKDNRYEHSRADIQTQRQVPMSQSVYLPSMSSSVPGSSRSEKAEFSEERDKLLKNQLGGVGGTNIVANLQLNQMNQKIDKLQSVIEKMTAASASASTEHESLAKIGTLLEQNEFTHSYINKIKSRLREKFSLTQLDDYNAVQKTVIEWVGENVLVAPKYEGKKRPHVVILVGPTGVGKTTTLAKMVAEVIFDARSNNKTRPVIRLITSDTMRVAALEQIQHYGDAFLLEVEKVSSCSELTELFKLYNDPSVDYIFIDTSGFSPNDHENIVKMKEMLSVKNMKADIYLVVTASTKSRDLEKILNNYALFDYRSVIVTKCDETSSFGNVLSVLHENNKEISWLTDGQEILHNMERCSPLYFLRNLDGFDVDEEFIGEKFGNEATEEDNGHL